MESNGLLWERVCLGDEQAFVSLYEEYGQQLFSFGTRFTADRELIKDCIQEIFTRIYQNRRNLNSTDNVRFYLYLSLKNELLQAFRKQAKLPLQHTESLAFLADFSSIEEEVENDSDEIAVQKVTQMLNALPSRQKEILYYRYIEELSFDEICQLMEINYQSAQNLIQRSIKKLRSIYSSISALSYLFFY